jgi:sialate O-acetylesterase
MKPNGAPPWPRPTPGYSSQSIIGEAHDIFPKNKLDVGKRLARWALVDVYGRKLTRSGPMFSWAKVGGSKVVLTFNDVGQGLSLVELRRRFASL